MLIPFATRIHAHACTVPLTATPFSVPRYFLFCSGDQAAKLSEISPHFEFFEPPFFGEGDRPRNFGPNVINSSRHHQTCSKFGDDRPSDLRD